jgi:hypothetical protein
MGVFSALVAVCQLDFAKQILLLKRQHFPDLRTV